MCLLLFLLSKSERNQHFASHLNVINNVAKYNVLGKSSIFDTFFFLFFFFYIIISSSI